MSARGTGSAREGFLVIRVEGMTCGHCRAAVQRALLGVRGVKSADVDLETGTAKVVFDPDTAACEDMVRAVEEEGYRVPSLG